MGLIKEEAEFCMCLLQSTSMLGQIIQLSTFRDARDFEHVAKLLDFAVLSLANIPAPASNKEK